MSAEDDILFAHALTVTSQARLTWLISEAKKVSQLEAEVARWRHENGANAREHARKMHLVDVAAQRNRDLVVDALAERDEVNRKLTRIRELANEAALGEDVVLVADIATALGEDVVPVADIVAALGVDSPTSEAKPWCTYCGGEHLIEQCADYNRDEGWGHGVFIPDEQAPS